MTRGLAALRAADAISPLDAAFGSLLGRLARAEPEAVALAAALVSRRRTDGHSCVALREVAGGPFPVEGGEVDVGSPSLPPFAAFCDALVRSGLVAEGGGGPAPLVLDAEGRLYLGRLFEAERRVASRLLARLAAGTVELEAEATRGALAALFPAKGGLDLQAVAALSALRSRLAVVTGGPGTGKTTTVVRLIALLARLEPGLRVAVAAPTGKAAARLGEALRTFASTPSIGDDLRPALPETVQTVHRLLGYRPWDESFRFDEASPLPFDLVVVDEASMVDLSLMDALLAATPDSARLVLVGDKDQLASVEAGFVLGDLCEAADLGRGPSPAFAASCRKLLGAAPAAGPAPAVAGGVPLRDAVTRLIDNYRFEEQPGIAALAAAVVEGRSEDALASLEAGGRGDLALVPPPRGPEGLSPLFAEPVRAFLEAGSPGEALARAGGHRVLCALREGPFGVAGVNAAVERWARSSGLVRGTAGLGPAPILVTANDYGLGLWNGDLGVLWPEAGRLWAWFSPAPGAGAGAADLRRLPPGRLPAFQTAWAMTVHKSQGSELGEVLLVLPPRSSPVATRELVYTGITRARRRVTVVASRAILAEALGRRAARGSGLEARLRAGPSEARAL